MSVQELTAEQMAELRWQLNSRPVRALGTIARGEPLPPLPRCPGCGAVAERVDERLEDPQFGVYETALLARWLPCGHRFRGIVDPFAESVRPGGRWRP
ncbi:hypothetical protein [Streptomyces qinglanensis]|uniref:Uncharacterized protein n=1 Tax=Streptomyces qinglanensis TaxID=943816 RepID=A0A1H9U2V1_9ACTN|nr:hypothetical protein [Streptomyces qinglanensis]SES03890.1 hypothetical protein SAMN05421870_107282 [Streptomyces qinglanensis]